MCSFKATRYDLLYQNSKFFMMAILVCDWIFNFSFSVARFPLLSHDKYGIETIKTNAGNAGRWDEDRSWILYDKLASVFFCQCFLLVSSFRLWRALLSLSQNTNTLLNYSSHSHQSALLYLDFRGREFVCSPASLWGALVLLVEVDCSHLALLQEGQQNQPVAQHRWEWHHHTGHWMSWCRTNNRWHSPSPYTGLNQKQHLNIINYKYISLHNTAAPFINIPLTLQSLV